MRRTRKRLGEMLVEAGLLSDQQLGEALAGQKRSGLKLGEYLTQNDIIRERDLVKVVSQQLRIDTYRPEKYPYSTSLASLVTMESAQKYNLVPLVKRGQLLTIAMPDPMDINALDAIEILTNLEVDPVICTRRELERLMESIYGVRQGQLDEAVEDLEDMTLEGEEDDDDELLVGSLQDMAEEAPVVRLVNSILSQAVRDKASDIHISPEKDFVQMRFRVDGKLREVPAPPKQVFLPVISRLKILANMDIAVSRIPQDGRFSFTIDGKEINVRVSTLPTIYGENLVMRLLNRSSTGLSLDDLGLQDADKEKLLQSICKPYGMILTTGPTGSGKTTTLYGVLRKLNRPDVNIITLEDPVEYRIPKIRQVQLNRKAGMTFASGLRSILRQDPDTVMVGEIRDEETSAIAVQAAMTGHKLLGTLHTNDAAGAITRLIEMGVEPFLVASTLLVSIGQRLIRKTCPECRQPYEPSKELLQAFDLGPTMADGRPYEKGAGCYACNNTGYQGRCGVYEVLMIDTMIRELITARASSAVITQEAVKAGKLRTLREDAALKISQGITTVEEAASGVLV